jgi:hypothetical protein
VVARLENPRRVRRKVLVHRIKPADLPIEIYDESMQWMSYSLSIAQKLRNAGRKISTSSSFRIRREGFFHQTNNFAATAAIFVQLHGLIGMFAEHGLAGQGLDSAADRVLHGKSVIHHADGVLASSHNTAKFCHRTNIRWKRST